VLLVKDSKYHGVLVVELIVRETPQLLFSCARVRARLSCTMAFLDRTRDATVSYPSAVLEPEHDLNIFVAHLTSVFLTAL